MQVKDEGRSGGRELYRNGPEKRLIRADRKRAEERTEKANR